MSDKENSKLCRLNEYELIVGSADGVTDAQKICKALDEKRAAIAKENPKFASVLRDPLLKRSTLQASPNQSNRKKPQKRKPSSKSRPKPFENPCSTPPRMTASTKLSAFRSPDPEFPSDSDMSLPNIGSQGKNRPSQETRGSKRSSSKKKRTSAKAKKKSVGKRRTSGKGKSGGKQQTIKTFFKSKSTAPAVPAPESEADSYLTDRSADRDGGVALGGEFKAEDRFSSENEDKRSPKAKQTKRCGFSVNASDSDDENDDDYDPNRKRPRLKRTSVGSKKKQRLSKATKKRGSSRAKAVPQERKKAQDEDSESSSDNDFLHHPGSFKNMSSHHSKMSSKKISDMVLAEAEEKVYRHKGDGD